MVDVRKGGKVIDGKVEGGRVDGKVDGKGKGR
jgi:hypothetical protein